MTRNVFTKFFQDHRVALIGWSIAFVVLTLIYAGFYPVVSDQKIAAAYENFPPAMREAFGLEDLSTPTGYLRSTIFSMVIPITAAIFAIVSAGWVTGEDEENGTLDLFLAQPISRTGLLVQRSLALACAQIWMAALVWVSIVLISPVVSLDVGPSLVLAACLQLFGLGMFFAGLTILVAGATGRKGLALAVSGGVAILTYLLSSFIAQQPDWVNVKYFSPFFYYKDGDPLVNGVQWPGLVGLVGVGVMLCLGAVAAFSRRDIRSV